MMQQSNKKRNKNDSDLSLRLPRPVIPNEYSIKVLVIGEQSTGKTSFIRRYVNQFFSRVYKITIGIDFALKTIQLDENTIVRLQLWDVAGQERIGTMTRVYYRDALGAFVVFDVSRHDTFKAVVKWKKDLDSKVSLSDSSNIPCLLLANKCDLMEVNEVEKQRLKEFAKQNGFFGYVFTSSKDNINIDSAILLLVKEIMRRQQNLYYEDNTNNYFDKDTIDINSHDSPNKRTLSCCASQ